MNVTGNPILDEQLMKLNETMESLKNNTGDQNKISDLINKAFKLIHNIKSNLFLIDHTKSLKMTYYMERYFERLRIENHKISEKFLTTFMECIQWISDNILEEVSTDQLYDKLMADLKKVKISKYGGNSTNEKLNLSADEEALLRDARNSGLNIFITSHPLVKDISRKEYNELPIIKYINNIGMIIQKTPAYNRITEIISDEDLFLSIVFVTDKVLDELDSRLLKSLIPFEEDMVHNKKNYRILIVEDNPVALLLQRSLLSSYGICEGVADGETALELFKSAIEEDAPYDIILLDLVMPGIGGAEVLKGIREFEENQDIRGLERSKVVISTTTSESSTLMNLFRAETDAYIIKPMTGEKIEKVLSNLKLI